MEEKADIVGDGYVIKEDKEDNRIKFIFEGKPEAEIRTILKSNGFRWSPYNCAWQRMLNGNGRYSTKRVVSEMENLKQPVDNHCSYVMLAVLTKRFVDAII